MDWRRRPKSGLCDASIRGAALKLSAVIHAIKALQAIHMPSSMQANRRACMNSHSTPRVRFITYAFWLVSEAFHGRNPRPSGTQTGSILQVECLGRSHCEVALSMRALLQYALNVLTNGQLIGYQTVTIFVATDEIPGHHRYTYAFCETPLAPPSGPSTTRKIRSHAQVNRTGRPSNGMRPKRFWKIPVRRAVPWFESDDTFFRFTLTTLTPYLNSIAAMLEGIRWRNTPRGSCHWLWLRKAPCRPRG